MCLGMHFNWKCVCFLPEERGKAVFSLFFHSQDSSSCSLWMCELYLVSDEWGYVFVSKHEWNNKNRLPLWPLYFSSTGWKSNTSARTLDVDSVPSCLFVPFCSLSACPEILDWQKVLVKRPTCCWAPTFPYNWNALWWDGVPSAQSI